VEGETMNKAETTTPKENTMQETEKPEFLDWAIDLFKKLLEYNWMGYGTKKSF
jgi:hypothetical protein